MRAAWTIALKDLRQRLRDRSAYIIGIGAPLGLALIFGFVFGPLQEEYEYSATVVVVDLDGGPVSELFIEGTLAQLPDVEVQRAATVEAATEMVAGDPNPLSQDSDKADAAFVFPPNFSADVQSERPVEIQVIGNRQSQTAAGLAASLAEGYASELSSVRVAVATVEELVGAEVDRLATGVAILQTESPATLVDITTDTKQLDAVTYYAAGMAIFFLFFTVQFGVTSILRERADGTLGRLVAAPIGKSSIVAGKAISAFLLGLISSAVLVVATNYAVDAKWGEPLGVAALVLAGVIAAIGVMALVSAFAKTVEQALALSSGVAIVLGFLGGTFVDVSGGQGFLATLRYASPHAWFMQGLADLTTGDVSVVVVPVLVMLAFGVIAGALSLTGMRRGLQP